jgi:hypothetical protein
MHRTERLIAATSLALASLLPLLCAGRLNASYPTSPESTAVVAVRAMFERRWNDYAAMVDSATLADFSRSFLRCSDNPSGRAFRQNLGSA